MRGRTRRFLGVLGRALRVALVSLALLSVFVASAGVAAVLHLDLPAPRRVAARTLTQLLSEFFEGSLTVGSLERLGLGGFAAGDVVVHDTDQRVVLSVTRLRAHADVVEIVRQLAFGAQKETLIIPHIRLEQAECEFIPDSAVSTPSLIHALTPKPGPERPEREPHEPRYVRVWMPDIEVGRAFGRGRVGELPTLEAELSRVRGSVLASPKGAAIIVHRFGAVVRGLGGTDARGTGDLNIRVPGAIWTTFNGRFGDVEVGAFVRVDGPRLTLRLELPRADPESVRALWPTWPLHRPLHARVEASGELRELQTHGVFEVDGGRLSAEGSVRLTGDIGADLDVDTQNFDLRAVVQDAPATQLTARSEVRLWQLDQRLVLAVNGTAQPTELEGLSIPAVDLLGRYDTRGFTGEATLHEPGMPVKLDFVVTPERDLQFQARAPRFRVQRAPRIRHYTNADADAEVVVRGKVQKQRLSASVSATLDDLRLAQVRMDRARLTGTVAGPVASPLDWQLDVKLDAADVTGGWFGFEQVDAHADGTAREAHVSAKLRDAFGPNVDASAEVLPVAKSLRDLHLSISRGDVTLDGKVERLDLEGGGVEISDLDVHGAGGTLEGSVRIHPDSVHVVAEGENLDLTAITGALGLPEQIGGRVSFRANVRAGREPSQGSVWLAWGDGTIAAFGGISANVEANLDAQRLDGTASLILADRGVFGISWDATLGGSLLDPKAWEAVTGRADVGFGQLNLEGGEFLFPSAARLERIDGHAFGQVRLERRDPSALPTVAALIGTQGLVVAQAPDDDDLTGESALVIEGLDLQVGATVDGESGAADATARLIHDRSVFLALTAESRLDLQGLRSGKLRPAEQLASLPIDAVITVQERPLSALPELVRPEGVDGKLSGKVTINGTASRPVVSASALLQDLRSQSSRFAIPVDLQLSGQYESETGRFGGRGELRVDRRAAAQLTAQGSAPLAKLLGPSGAAEPVWTGQGQLLLQDLPLSVVPWLADSRIAGSVRGTVALQREALVPEARASLSLREPSIDGIAIGEGKVALSLRGRKLDGSVTFVDGERSARARVRGILRDRGGWPALDTEQPTIVDLDASRFEAVVLQPLLGGSLSKLSGEIDAKLRAELTERAASAAAEQKRWHGRFSGSASLRGGTLQLAGLGMTLNDVRLDATAEHKGAGTLIQIPELRAKARSSTHNLRGSAALYLDGLRFSHGQASIQTVGRDVPLQVQGVTLASVAGEATAFLQHQEEGMRVEVEIPELVARLPRSTDRSLIDLDPNENIVVGQPLGEPEEPRTGTVLPWVVTFHLGDRVRVVRSDLYVPVTGKPVISLGNATLVSGYVDLEPGGRLQALGKDFEVRSGRLRFDTGDNSNPHVDVTAAWLAAEATVYIEIHGTLEDATIAFRSDPPRPEQEVIALLLSGSADDDESMSSGAETGAALGAASQSAAPILDEVFENTPLSGIKFRATAAEGKPSYVAAYRISDRVWLEGIYNPEGGLTDTSGGGEQVDLSNQGQHDAFAGAIDYRFHRNWSLRTEAGNASAGLDVLWQYRY